jgi:ATP-binding protein involved in chromosome partitioning
MRYEVYISLRYLKAKRKQIFISVMSRLSVLALELKYFQTEIELPLFRKIRDSGDYLGGREFTACHFFLPEERAPTIWRGPLKMRAIRQLLTDVVWGELDVLFIDLPPGTGDEVLSIAQLLPDIDGVVIVTIPGELSRAVVGKAITFAERMGMPIIGVVENMSGYVCPNCGEEVEIFQAGGGRKMAEERGVPFLGKIPIDPKVSASSDNGVPFVTSQPESSASKAFIAIVYKVEEYLKARHARP